MGGKTIGELIERRKNLHLFQHGTKDTNSGKLIAERKGMNTVREDKSKAKVEAFQQGNLFARHPAHGQNPQSPKLQPPK